MTKRDNTPHFHRDGEVLEVLEFSPSEQLIWKATAYTTGGGSGLFVLTADSDHEGAVAGTFVLGINHTWCNAVLGGSRTVLMPSLSTSGGMKAICKAASAAMYVASPDPAALEVMNEQFATCVNGSPLRAAQHPKVG